MAPAVSGSKLTIDALGEAREEADLQCSVKAVPEVARTLLDAGHEDGDAVHLAFDEEGVVIRLRMAALALSRLKRTAPLV